MTDLRLSTIYQSNCQTSLLPLYALLFVLNSCNLSFVHLRYILGGTRPK
jgi:hypothetical protein